MRFERLTALWAEATPLKRAVIVGIPVVVLALAGAGIGLAAYGGGSGTPVQVRSGPSSTSTTTSTPSPAPPTATPASAGVQTPVPPPGGAPPANYTRVQQRSGSGPGGLNDTSMSMRIPSIGVNAQITSRTVGTNGVMGNPRGPWDVLWYDFSTFGKGAGGYPGEPGANAVFAGHVDYIRVGPAVFWRLREMKAGDIVTVNTPNGLITYKIVWTKWTGPDEDFGPYVSQNGQEMITLITCIGVFSRGEYSNRFIVRGVRV
ncbi:MAG: class F sortase [Dehalococcoidia bacterium]|nr:class F sortase [Dehalococcoidia bacterium]